MTDYHNMGENMGDTGRALKEMLNDTLKDTLGMSHEFAQVLHNKWSIGCNRNRSI